MTLGYKNKTFLLIFHQYLETATIPNLAKKKMCVIQRSKMVSPKGYDNIFPIDQAVNLIILYPRLRLYTNILNAKENQSGCLLNNALVKGTKKEQK